MSDYGLFWDSKNGDRKYSAESFEKWLKKFFTTGVFNGDLQVTATTGMGISVGTGYCNINGKVQFYERPTTFTLEVAFPSNNRVDTVVIERNDPDRIISIKVVKGGADGQPIPPVRANGIYQIVLAQISVGAGVTGITQSDITDTRVISDLCGYIVSTVVSVDFDQIMDQFTTWFNEYKQEIIHDFDDAGEMAQEIFQNWFSHMVDELDSDQAGHLQLEIDNLDAGKQNNDRWDIVTLSASRWMLNNGIYFYPLYLNYPNADYDITDVLPVSATTEDMKKAWSKANCYGYEPTNILTCHGKVPTIDIKIGLCVRPKARILY